MNKRMWGLSLVACAGAAWFWLKPTGAPTAPTPQLTENARTRSSEAPSETIASAPPGSDQPTPSQRVTAESRQAADRIRAVIAMQRAETNSPLARGNASTIDRPNARVAPGVAAPTTMPAPLGSGNQVNEALGRYVQDRVTKDFFPMAASCYQELLATRPGAAGKVVLDVTIVGDRSVGGVVDAVDVDADSTLKDEQLVVCLRESMFGTPFEPPPTGQEKVTFTFPIELSGDPPANAAAAPQYR